MPQHVKILIADDEADILDFISYNFNREGYQTLVARDGIEAIRLARAEKPDLIILDAVMPRLDGFAVTEHIRSLPETSSTLIVFLTALTDEESEMKAFRLGADDFISKPIKPKLLQCRVNALLRRKFERFHTSMDFGTLQIDTERRTVKRSDQEIYFPRKEFDLLALLSSRPGRVFPRHEILSKIWKEDTEVGDRTIDVHVRKLRQKIGETSIKTVKGVGYKFEL